MPSDLFIKHYKSKTTIIKSIKNCQRESTKKTNI